MRLLLVLIAICVWPAVGWAKTLKIPRGLINVTQLHDELVAEFPEWRGTPLPDGAFTDPLLRVEYSDDQIRLVVPDGADERAIDAVISSHAPKSKKQKKGASPKTFEKRVKRIEAILGLE